MDVAIRELDAAELDIVAGGGPSVWDVLKLVAGVAGSLIGGPVGGGAAVGAVMGIQASQGNMYVPDCSGSTGGCDAGSMMD